MAFICGGIALISGPWWLPFVALAASKIGIKIDTSTNYWLVGILILIGILIICFKFCYVDKRARLIENDKKIIAQSPVEFKKIKAYFDHLIRDHSYYSSMDDTFVQAYLQFSNASQALQDKKTASLFRVFSKDAENLHNFIKTNFFVFPEDQCCSSDKKYCLHPDLNIDRNMVFYDANKSRDYDSNAKILCDLVCNAEKSYNSFIDRLKILGHTIVS